MGTGDSVDSKSEKGRKSGQTMGQVLSKHELFLMGSQGIPQDSLRKFVHSQEVILQVRGVGFKIEQNKIKRVKNKTTKTK